MAEDDALKKFLVKRKNKNRNTNTNTNTSNYLGLTHERYESIYNSLKNIVKNFQKKSKKLIIKIQS